MPHTNRKPNNDHLCTHQSLASSEVLQGTTAGLQGGIFLGWAQQRQVGLHSFGVAQPLNTWWGTVLWHFIHVKWKLRRKDKNKMRGGGLGLKARHDLANKPGWMCGGWRPPPFEPCRSWDWSIQSWGFSYSQVGHLPEAGTCGSTQGTRTPVGRSSYGGCMHNSPQTTGEEKILITLLIFTSYVSQLVH